MEVAVVKAEEVGSGNVEAGLVVVAEVVAPVVDQGIGSPMGNVQVGKIESWMNASIDYY